MKTPLFQVSEPVYHLSKQKLGKVVHAFETETGWRYYVNHSRFTWSIPESALEPVKVKNRPQQNQLVTSENFLNLPAIAPELPGAA